MSEVKELLDPTILFADHHEGWCCDCCAGYCTLGDDSGPWWPAVYAITLGDVEYLGIRQALVRRSAVADLPETAGVMSPSTPPPTAWAVVPPERPPLSDRPQMANMLDRLDRAGLTIHEGTDVVHLYRGSDHVGWCKWAIDPAKGITLADLPTVRDIAKHIGLDVKRAAEALHLIRDGVHS